MRAEAAARRRPLEIWPENWDAVTVFLAADTQWRHAGLAGVPVGLDLAGVAAACRFVGVAPTADLLGRLRVLERAALKIIHAREARR